MAEEEQLKKTTEVFDDTIGSVLSGNEDKTEKPTHAAVMGVGNSVKTATRNCLIGGEGNTVNAPSNTVNGKENKIESSNAVFNNVSGQENELGSSAICNNVSGYGNTVDGNYNSVSGYENTVESDNSFVAGRGLKSYSYDQEGQMIGGLYNDTEEEIVDGVPVLFGIGNGNNDAYRGNALLIDKNGNMKVKGKVYFDGGQELKTGAKQSAVYSDYYYAVSALNSASNTDFEKGQTIRITGAGKCDLWIVAVESTQVSYSYSTSFIEDVRQAVTLQIGYYVVSLAVAESYAPASITLPSHSDLVSRLIIGGNALDTIKLTVGQTVHIKSTGLCDLYIDSRVSSFSSYTYAETLEADIIAAGGLLQIGYYMVGMVKGYEAAPTYDETLEILNTEETEETT